MIQYLPELYSACPYYYEALKLNIHNPLILTEVIPEIIYTIG